MKKGTCLILSLILFFVLIGCTRVQKPVLRVAMSPDFAPMEFIDNSKTGQEQFAGFDVSLARYLARQVGMDLQIIPLSLDACQSAVAEGRVELAISGFTWMPDRAEKFNLSDTYHAGDNSSHQVLLTTVENGQLYSNAENLRGVKIGVQAASLQEWLVTEQLPGAITVPFADITEGVEKLQKGDFTAMALAEGNADVIITANPGLCKSGFYFELTDDLLDNLILIKKGNDELTATVNDLLAKAEASGLYDRWYAEALERAGVGVEVTYDDEGNIATEGS